MDVVWFVIVLSLFVQKSFCGKRIFGGFQAKLCEYPYIVALAYKGFTCFCGGTLIDHYHVLTAAHCFRQTESVKISPKGVYAVAGDIDKYYNSSEYRRHLDIKVAVVHPGFDPESLVNDICILKLAEQLETNRCIRPIVVAEKPPPNFAHCEAIGWGKTMPYDFGSDLLLATGIQIVPFEKCEAIPELDPVFYEAQLCAGTESGENDTCQGDSGGPLICNGQLAGIVSFGHDCGVAGMYSIYTNVSHYLNWMTQVMSWDGDTEIPEHGDVLRFLRHKQYSSQNSVRAETRRWLFTAAIVIALLLYFQYI